jgi:hypothetical protein
MVFCLIAMITSLSNVMLGGILSFTVLGQRFVIVNDRKCLCAAGDFELNPGCS